MTIIIPRVKRIQCYKKYNGKCAYCGLPIEYKAMQVDHMEPAYRNWTDDECAQNNVVRGSDDIKNLMPACRRCNKWKSAFSIEKFRAELLAQFARLKRDSPNYKLIVDFGMIEEKDWDGKFYFEKHNDRFKSTSVKSDTAIDLIVKERQRQIDTYGYSDEYLAATKEDYGEGELAMAAAAYLCSDRWVTKDYGYLPDILFPWNDEYFKPSPNDRIKELQKAGAMIIAEIDRLIKTN